MHPSRLVLDSVTHLTPEHCGRPAHCASHGGRYAGYYAARMGLGAVILNDAGIGRERAGLAGIAVLQGLGVPAATLSHRTARIGDGAHGHTNGVVSYVNTRATALGVTTGMTCAAALEVLADAELTPAASPPDEAEHRLEMAAAGNAGVKVWVMDSISLVLPEDAGHIVVTGSHGGLLAGMPETAVKYPAFAVVCSDADRGIDDAGISRLPALDARGIAGACVSAFSARIGDGRSIYEDGYISALNPTAVKHGGGIGQCCKDFVAAMVAARIKDLGS